MNRSHGNSEQVGYVSKLSIYPVKGMNGVSVNEIDLKSISVSNDRLKAFTIVNSTLTPSLLDTIKFPDLLKYNPYLKQSENEKYPKIRVKSPEGKDYAVDSNELLNEISNKYKKQLALLSMGRAAYHSMPISLISISSIEQIEKILEFKLNPERFRQNIIVETLSKSPYEEDLWINKIVSFGDSDDGAKIIVVKLDKRCATVNLDHETFENNPQILKAIVENHDNTLGVYCSIIKEGKVRTGDRIYIGLSIYR